jgi:STE24 endopeptidase
MAGAINDCLVRHHVRELGDSALDALQGGIMVVLAAGVFLAAPVLVVHIWRTRPLPPGPLRQELQADLARLKLRCREILLWQSGGVIANAGVMGLVGPLRYVLLSDALLENLPHRHLQAVFAHEAGHIVSHHIFYAALFAMSTMILAGTAWGAMQAIGINPVVSQVAALVVLGLAWWLFFGRLSRTFERQSDVIGAWTVGLPYNTTGDPDRIVPEGAAIFAQALQQVAQLNGIPSSGPNWRHGSIESRVSYLFWLGSTGSTRRDIDRKVRWIKGGLWALLAVSLAVAAVQERLTG